MTNTHDAAALADEIEKFVYEFSPGGMDWKMERRRLLKVAISLRAIPAEQRVCPICDSPAVQKNGYCNNCADLAPGPSEAKQEPVAWRWRPPGAANWIYDPEMSWFDANRSEIEHEPLYTRPSQAIDRAILECGEWRQAVVELRDMVIDAENKEIEQKCFNILMERSLWRSINGLG